MRNKKITIAALGAATAVLATGFTAASVGTANASGRSTIGACSTSAVRLSWDVNAIQTAGPGENVAVLKVKNISHRTCALSGFPTVVLRASDFNWKLKHHGMNRTYNLKPGKSASFGISYVRVYKHDSRAVKPSKTLVTLPGQHRKIKVSWPYGYIANQAAMRHPQTYSGGFFR